MSDACLIAALRWVGKRPSWTPGTWYHGDRPCLPLKSLRRVMAWSSWDNRSGEYKLLTAPLFKSTAFPKARRAS